EPGASAAPIDFARRSTMRRLLLALAVAARFCDPSFAADGKGIRFWNLTSSTITNLQLSPAGQNAWGPNQCANDPDGAVDHAGRRGKVGRDGRDQPALGADLEQRAEE